VGSCCTSRCDGTTANARDPIGDRASFPARPNPSLAIGLASSLARLGVAVATRPRPASLREAVKPKTIDYAFESRQRCARNLAEREEAVLVHWRHVRTGYLAALISISSRNERPVPKLLE
jgi:hypothetical protein